MNEQPMEIDVTDDTIKLRAAIIELTKEARRIREKKVTRALSIVITKLEEADMWADRHHSHEA